MELGTGHIEVQGLVEGGQVHLQSTYHLQRMLKVQVNAVCSDDGNSSLQLDAGSLLGDDAYLVVMPPGALPAQPPEGLLLLGDAYDITASGALVTLEKPGILTLYYGAALADPSSTPHNVAIYRWDAFDREWEKVGGDLIEEQKMVSAPVTILGTYALLAPSQQNLVYLPLILKGVP